MDAGADIQVVVNELRCQWQLAAAVQFLVQFGRLYNIELNKTEDLELGFAQPLENSVISDIFAKLLSFLTRKRSISNQEWEGILRVEAGSRGLQDLFPEDVKFVDLPPVSKLLLLNELCNWQLEDVDRFRSRFPVDETEDESQWRVEPLGSDSKWNTYWLFDDNRLYREEWKPPDGSNYKSKTKKKRAHDDAGASTGWSLMCARSDEWRDFPERFKNSRSAREQQFYEYLTSDILPVILPELESRERTQRKQEREQILPRKRSMRIHTKEIEKLEHQRLTESSSPGSTRKDKDSAAGREDRLKQRQQRYERMLEIQQLQQVKEQQKRDRLTKDRDQRPSLGRAQLSFSDSDSTSNNDEPSAYETSSNLRKQNEEERTVPIERHRHDDSHRKYKKEDQPNQHENQSHNTINEISTEQPVLSKLFDSLSPSKSMSRVSASPIVKSKSKTGQNLQKPNKQSPSHSKPKTKKRKKKPKFSDIEDDEDDDEEDDLLDNEEIDEVPYDNSEPSSWTFKCICGLSGQNYDDGSEMIVCERCDVWQHVKCHGLRKAALSSLEFICRECTVNQEHSYTFSCRCGLNGTDIDDGTEMIQCSHCNVWMHVACQPGLHALDLSTIDFACDVCSKVRGSTVRNGGHKQTDDGDGDFGRPQRARKPSRRMLPNSPNHVGSATRKHTQGQTPNNRNQTNVNISHPRESKGTPEQPFMGSMFPYHHQPLPQQVSLQHSESKQNQGQHLQLPMQHAYQQPSAHMNGNTPNAHIFSGSAYNSSSNLAVLGQYTLAQRELQSQDHLREYMFSQPASLHQLSQPVQQHPNQFLHLPQYQPHQGYNMAFIPPHSNGFLNVHEQLPTLALQRDSNTSKEVHHHNTEPIISYNNSESASEHRYVDTVDGDNDQDDDAADDEDAESESYQFSCVCGISMPDYDDGTPMVTCAKCNIRMHAGCLDSLSSQHSDHDDDDHRKAIIICASCSRFVSQ